MSHGDRHDDCDPPPIPPSNSLLHRLASNLHLRPQRDPSNASLCSACAKLPLDELFSAKLKHKLLSRFSTLERRSRRCALCRFIYVSIRKLSCDKYNSSVGIGTYGGTAFIYTTICLLSEAPGMVKVHLSSWNSSKFATTQVGRSLHFYIQRVSDDTVLPLSNDGTYGSKEVIDLSLICDWTRTCANKHGDECESQAWESVMQPLTSLRVIDTWNTCLATPSGSCQFVALSYVWGGGESLQLMKQNKEEWSKPGGLSPYLCKLPLTITDAMHVVRGMGERYLWVDRLCITQDDPGEKHAKVSSMDAIYGSALLTIVAADGADANAGLPGVRARSRYVKFDCYRSPKTFIQEVKPNFRLMAPIERDGSSFRYTTSDNSQNPICETPWFQRGWTFQEWVLSKRLLIFTNNQVFWHCKRAVWSENLLATEKDYYGYCIDRRFPAIERLQLESRYLANKKKAGHMDLSVELRRDGSTVVVRSDTFRAYDWAIQHYTRRLLSHQSDGLEAFHGISKILSLFLDCEMCFGLPEALFDVALLWQPKERLCRRKQGFPSWCWAGWIGQVGYESTYGESGEEGIRSIVRWHKVGKSGRQLIPLNETGFGIRAAATAEGRLPDGWDGMDGTLTRTNFSQLRLSQPLDQQCLYFRTSCASFKIKKIWMYASVPDAFDMIDSKGEWAGIGLTDSGNGPRTGFTCIFDFIVLSEAQHFGTQHSGRIKRDTQKRLHSDRKAYSLYNVMLVKWDADRILAHRLGLARVFKDSWTKANPQDRLVILR